MLSSKDEKKSNETSKTNPSAKKSLVSIKELEKKLLELVFMYSEPGPYMEAKKKSIENAIKNIINYRETYQKTLAKFSEKIEVQLPDLDVEDSTGRTALSHVSSKNASEITTLLIQHGANVNNVDKEGRSPLYYAIAHGRWKNTEFLIEAKANLNQPELLKMASIHDKTDLVIKIIQAKVDVNHRFKSVEKSTRFNATKTYYSTALIEAAQKRNLDTVKALLDAGASLNQHDRYEYSFFFEQHFIKEPHQHASALLRSYHGDNNVVLDYLLKLKKTFKGRNEEINFIFREELKKNSVLLKKLLDAKADVNQEISYIREIDYYSKEYCRVTPLLYAVQNNQLELAKLLMDFKADVDKRHGHATMNSSKMKDTDHHFSCLSYNDTPLMMAWKNNNVEMMTSLLEMKANINARNEENFTLLMLAAKDNNMDMLKFLLEKKADPNVQKSYFDKTTAITIASRNADPECIKILCEKAFLKILGAGTYSNLAEFFVARESENRGPSLRK